MPESGNRKRKSAGCDFVFFFEAYYLDLMPFADEDLRDAQERFNRAARFWIRSGDYVEEFHWLMTFENNRRHYCLGKTLTV
jgi:hypothetical protein